MAKIIFLANSPSPNTTDLYRLLNAKMECQVCVVYTSERQNKKWASPIVIDGYESFFPPNSQPFYRWPITLFNLLRASDVRLVVVQGYMPFTHLFIIMALSAFRRRPWIFWGERMRIWPDESLLRKLGKRFLIGLIGRADRVLAIGATGMEKYAELGIDRAALSSIPYARNLAPFLTVRESASKSELWIVCTARLIPSKGVDQLIDVFARLAASRRGLMLQVIGDGPERPKLEASIPPALRSRVTFHGHLDTRNQIRIYSRSHVFVLPSYHDGWGMVVLEAMASGLPVVTTDAVVSATELLHDGRAGVLVPPRDTDALFDAVRLLIDNPTLRNSKGAAARCLARRYDSSYIASDLGKILSGVLCANR